MITDEECPSCHNNNSYIDGRGDIRCRDCSSLVRKVIIMKISVNGESVSWTEKTISYSRVLELTGKQDHQTVIVSYPLLDKKSRTLTDGEAIDVFDGMVIDCTRTDNA